MMTQVLTGLLLLVLPVAYNLFFTLLARGFDYPDILRQPGGVGLPKGLEELSHKRSCIDTSPPWDPQG